MLEQFSIGQSQFRESSGSALRDAIHERTQSLEETARILSAIQRFGVDPSIEGFDLIPSANRTIRGATGTSWMVRARRKGAAPADPLPEV